MRSIDSTYEGPARDAALPRVSGADTAYWALRLGAGLCLIGHGAFGFITKAAWLPYFGVAGIPASWAWNLMPLIGAVDVTAGMAILFAPRALPLAYLSVWGLWTALLRPLAGESVFEAVERAGNYGVPFALLLMTAMPRSLGGLTTLLNAPVEDRRTLALVARTLKWVTVLLLAGHGVLGAITGKAMFATHYASIGLPPNLTAPIGWFEIALAIAVAARPAAGLLLFVAAWKVATESLYVISGAPVWELVERAGSIAAPLALAALMRDTCDQG